MFKRLQLICCFLMACGNDRPDFGSYASTNAANTSGASGAPLLTGSETATAVTSGAQSNAAGPTLAVPSSPATDSLSSPDRVTTCTGDCTQGGANSEQPVMSIPGSSALEPTCTDQCTRAETSCSEGELRVCEPDANGCLIWFGPTDCDSGFCEDEESCLDTPTCNASNQDDCPCEEDEKRPCRGEGSTCEGSTQSCEDGAWSECSIVPATEDTCEPGNDANCNGERNEGCPCVDDETQDCGNPAIGICKRGKQTCQNKIRGDCVGEVQPKARDCSSSADNDCNGMADNTVDNVCKCAVGETQTCNEHPGKDGNPPCQAGSQTCELAADKASSKWSSCAGDVGPASRDTCEPGNDANCNGEENEGCNCVNGTQVACECGGTVTCANGALPGCAQLPVTRYRDGDNDGFGNANNSSLVCANELGWVPDNTDCDDNDPNMYAGVATCTSALDRKWCPDTGGTLGTASCRDGCFDGECRSDGTIGVPGTVSCDGITRCSTADGCHFHDGNCNPSEDNYRVSCDAHSDCPSGQKCWHFSFMGANLTECAASQPGSDYNEVCDPLNPTCVPCTAWVENLLYTCQ